MMKKCVRQISVLGFALLTAAPVVWADAPTGDQEARAVQAEAGALEPVADGLSAAQPAPEASPADEARADEQVLEESEPDAQTEADSSEPVAGGTALDLIEELRAKGLIDAAEAESLKQRYSGRAAQDFMDELAGRVAAELDDSLGQRIRRELSRGVSQPPEWLSRIKLSGDIRLRYQGDYYADHNLLQASPANPNELLTTDGNRNRLRLRARLATGVKLSDSLDAAIVLSTGSTSDPASTNTTFGSYLKKSAVLVDQAWVRYRPLPELSLWMGRMPNPWLSSELVWDKSLNFEGVAVQFDSQVARHLRGFITLGAFPLHEIEYESRDKWLYGVQTGFKCSLPAKSNFKLGLALYDFSNLEGIYNDPTLPGWYDWTQAPYVQKGNSLMNIDAAMTTASYKPALVDDYDELSLTALLDIGVFDPVHVMLSGDYVKNVGWDKARASRRTGNTYLDEETVGYRFGLEIGYPVIAERGQWRAGMSRRRLEKDAVLDAFADATFHTGGTNCQGYVISGEVGLAKNVSAGLQWMSSDEVSGYTLGVDSLLLELNVKF